MDPQLEAAHIESPPADAPLEGALGSRPEVEPARSPLELPIPRPLSVLRARAQGVTLWDADGNEYLDFNMGFGSLQSGHAHPKLVEALAHQLENGSVYGYEWERTPEVAERISGGIACRRSGSARPASKRRTTRSVSPRAYTKKRYVLKFEGSYHGSHDSLLVGVKPRLEVAGPHDHPKSAPASPGILSEVSDRTLVAPFNDLAATGRSPSSTGTISRRSSPSRSR